MRWSGLRFEPGTLAAQALRHSDEVLRPAARYHTIPTMAWTVRPDGAVDFVNQRWLDYTGLSFEEEIEEPTRAVHPEDLQRVMEKWLAHMPAGESFEDEMRLRHADGEYRWFLVRTVPLRDEQRTIVKWYGSSIDIEDRKRAEVALRQSEDHLRLVIDTIPVMAWSLRPDGTVDFLNQRWIDYSGLSLEQYVEEPTRPIHPADIPRAMEKWRSDMAAGEPSEDEMRLRRADGEYRWFLVRTAPLRDEQGDIVKWYGVSIDIQERKQAEERLRETSEQLRALSASLRSAREEEGARIAREIHDELGSALMSLKWDLEEVDKALSDPEGRARLSAPQEKIGVMTRLLDMTINAVRRISSELRPSVLDDLGLVEAIEWQAQQFQARTGIVCRCDCSLENLVLSQEKSTALFRILQEALTNIIRHARATEVDIVVDEEGGEVVLTVSDDGRGITEGEKTGRQSLGLLGMRERARLVGGRVDINGAEGGGTVITVRVPVSA